MNTSGESDENLKISAFWRWFAENDAILRNLVPESPPWLELEQRLRSLGVEAWEIGPAAGGRTAFAISPARSPEKLPLTRKIVGLAPSIPGWLFFSAKQPKDWNRVFVWSLPGLEIDARQWKFLVYRYADGLFDVVLLGPILDSFSKEERLRIVSFVVESEIGEEILVERVFEVDLEEAPTEDMLNSAVPIEQLRSTIDSE